MTLSRASLSPLTSSPALSGPSIKIIKVLEDMDVTENAGDDVRGIGEPLESFTKNFLKSKICAKM